MSDSLENIQEMIKEATNTAERLDEAIGRIVNSFSLDDLNNNKELEPVNKTIDILVGKREKAEKQIEVLSAKRDKILSEPKNPILVSTIEKLCKEHSISVAALERECNLSNGSVKRWVTSNPTVDKLQKIASYFNVSLDYLMGNRTTPESDIIDIVDLFSKKEITFKGKYLTKSSKKRILGKLNLETPEMVRKLEELMSTELIKRQEYEFNRQFSLYNKNAIFEYFRPDAFSDTPSGLLVAEDLAEFSTDLEEKKRTNSD